MSECKTVLTTREVIERKILDTIDDPHTVAILASKDDLDMMIAALQALHGTYPPLSDEYRAKIKEYGTDLMKLRAEAF